MISSIILIPELVLFVFLAGLFAGSETGMYKLSRLRLRFGIEKKQIPFVTLGKCLRDSSGLLLSLLIGTNLTHYLATNVVTGIFLNKVGVEHTAELFTVLATAPVLFVFSELVPKNIFFYRADMLMPYISPVLYALHKVLSLSGIVPLLKLISSFFAGLAGLAASSKTVMTSVQRHKVQSILHDTREEGILSPVQSDIVNRLVSISHIPIRTVMTPMNIVQTVDFDSDNSALLDKLKQCPFSRLPVVKGQPGNIVGYINIYEALCSDEQFTDLQMFVKPIRRLDADTNVADAMNIMQEERQKILLVIKGGLHIKERPIGIVTMKDLVEELLGELTEW
jgi:putative hemolysin